MAKSNAYELIKLEKILIRALVEGDEKIRSFIIQQYRPEHLENFNDIFTAVLDAIAENDPKLLNLDVLIHNEKLSVVSRGMLQALPNTVLVLDPGQLEIMVEPLIEEYNSNYLLEMIRPDIEGLQKREISHNDALAQILMKAESYNSQLVLGTEPPLELGRGCNLEKAIDKVFTPGANNFLRSGFGFIDRRAGGFSRGDLVVVASPSSQGKTLMMIQLLNNMLFMNPNTPISALFVTLEVKDATIMHRMVSNRGHYPFVKIRECTMPEALLTEYCKTKEERDKRLQEVERYRQFGKEEMVKMYKNLGESGHKLMVKTYGSFTPEDLLREMALNPYDLVVIDYINLMSTLQQTDADWLRLSMLSRQLKNIATTKGCVIVTAQQLDSEKKEIRYGKCVLENADVLIKWELSEELRNAGGGETDIHIAKGRNIGTFSTKMIFDLTCQGVQEGGEENKFEGKVSGLEPIANETFNPFL